MALNINKGGKTGKYFYLNEDGIDYGPFEISDLLEKINSDTLVCFKGIDWTKASEISELKRYFSVEKIVVEKVIERTHVETVPSKKSPLLTILLIFIILGAGLAFFLYQKGMKNKQYEEGQIMLNQKRIADSIAGVNTKLLFELQKDSINDAYTSRLDSLKDIENKLFFLQNQSALIQKIDNYYLDIANNKMNAYDYFSDTVNQFINLFNISPEEINKVFTGELDYTDEHVIFDKNSFIFSSHRADLFYFNYTIQYSCFRKKRNMTQKSDVDIEIGFNDKLQIKSLKELEIRNLIFE